MFLTPSVLSFPFYRLMNDDYIPSKNVQGPFKYGFMFLLRLAWQSRLRLPALVFLAYMLFDIRIQFEMDIHPQRELIDVDDDDEDDDDDDEDEEVDEDEEDGEESEEEEEETNDLLGAYRHLPPFNQAFLAQSVRATSTCDFVPPEADAKEPPSF